MKYKYINGWVPPTPWLKISNLFFYFDGFHYTILFNIEGLFCIFKHIFTMDTRLYVNIKFYVSQMF